MALCASLLGGMLPPRVSNAARPYRPAAFDLGAAAVRNDLLPIEIQGATRVVEGVTVHQVRFHSLVWDTHGTSRPIAIEAFLAIPPGARSPRPAVISAHGLGARAELEGAVELARNLDVVALSVSAPGAGNSEGPGVSAEDSHALFTTWPDIRHSWLYEYVYALLRAVTFLQTRPEVDPEAIVLTGFSMGGVASFIAGGTDDRLRGILPMGAAGGWERQIAEGSWLARLVLSAGARPSDRSTRALVRALDPLAYADRQKSPVYMLIGAQDEFFTIDQAVRTYQALRAPVKSLAVVADFDHQWYFAYGCPARCMPGPGGDGASAGPALPDCPPPSVCPARCPEGAQPPYCGPQASYNRHDEFISRWALLLRSLVARHAARPRRPFSDPPEAPLLERSPEGLVVRLAPGVHARAVRLALSDNSGYTYGQFELSPDADGLFRLTRRLGKNLISFAEVETDDGVVATSVPLLPPNFRPRVRPFGPHP